MRVHDEHLSAYLDNRLSPMEKAEVENILRSDAEKSAELTCARTVKMLLQERQHSLRGKTPAEARHLVLLNLEQEWVRSETLKRIETESQREATHQAAQNQKPTQKAVIFQIPIRQSAPQILAFFQQRPAMMAAAMMFIVAGWFLIRGFSSSTNANKQEAKQTTTIQTLAQKDSFESVFIKESLRNFHAVSEGKISLQCKTNSYEKLDKFFAEHGIQYNIVHPKIQAELLGGVVSEENGKKSAHLVFKRGDTLLYMWEIDLDEETTRHVAFSDDIWTLLRKGEWLWDTKTEDSTTVVFWEDDKKDKRTLCAVVGHLPRTELQPLFQ